MSIIFSLRTSLVVGSSVVVVIWSPDSTFFSVEVLYNLLPRGPEMSPSGISGRVRRRSIEFYGQGTTVLGCLNGFEGKLSPTPTCMRALGESHKILADLGPPVPHLALPFVDLRLVPNHSATRFFNRSMSASFK